MENASKALLIAGAVLVVILIIGVGMLIYQSSMSTIDEAIRQMSSQEKELFNSQFTQYEGRITGARVKALIQKVNTNNSELESGDAKTVTITNQPAKINTAQTYDVSVTDTNKDGLVDTVTIVLYTNT